MTEQTPSGNRWEPTDPTPPTAAAPPSEPPAAPDAYAAAARPSRTERVRDAVRRTPVGAWLAGALAALLVFVGAGGFLVGRATADHDQRQVPVNQQWDDHGHGFGPGGPGGLDGRDGTDGGDGSEGEQSSDDT